MIPYFSIVTVDFGPVRIYTWGLLVALGIAAALAVAYQRLARRGLGTAHFLDLAAWAVAAAFIGARLFYVFFYGWSDFSGRWWDILKIWQGGMSSFGGFFGAAVATFVYARVKKISLGGYVDAALYAFPLGLGIGRLGCFFAHLHLGRLNNSFFAVNFPDGARLDMGLLESVFGFIWFGIYFLFLRKNDKKIFLPLTMFIYGSGRFVLDFGRAADILGADARYAGLTPAQYGSFALILAALYLWRKNPFKPGQCIKLKNVV